MRMKIQRSELYFKCHVEGPLGFGNSKKKMWTHLLLLGSCVSESSKATAGYTLRRSHLFIYLLGCYEGKVRKELNYLIDLVGGGCEFRCIAVCASNIPNFISAIRVDRL